MNRMRRFIATAIAMLGALGATGPGSRAVATPFAQVVTYQGEIKNSGVPMSGNADLVFKLFDAASGGNQVGVTVTANGVPLTDGRFTVALDFTNGGAIPDVYDGNERWLSTSVNGTLLSPRQRFTPAPHAVTAEQLALPYSQSTALANAFTIDAHPSGAFAYALSVSNACADTGAIAIMGIASAQTNKNTVGVLGRSYAANGVGVIGDNASAIGNCSGVYGSASSTSGIGVLGIANSPSGSTRGVQGRVVSPDGYAGYFEGRGFFSQAVGIRTVGNPAAMLDVEGFLPSSGLAFRVGSQLYANAVDGFVGVNRSTQVTGAESFGVTAPAASNAYGGMYINTSAADALPFYGYATNGTARAWTYYDGGADSWYLHLGGANRIVALGATGNIGIKRTPATNDFEVEGTASKTTAGSWLANSDARIKRDVRTIDHALETLDRVRLVDFRYTDEYRRAHPEIEDRRYLNVIAQEFREVFPADVKGSGEKLPNGEEILQVDTYPLTIYSAAAVQELHRMLNEKEARIADLSARLTRLEAAFAARDEDGRERMRAAAYQGGK